jgi:urease accessory protein
MKQAIFVLAALFAATTIPALAHTGVGSVAGFAAGFSHPIGGLDHILAMIAVGILAAQLGGRAIWIVPAAFVGMMLVGAVFGILGVGIPFVEQRIVGSVIILGTVIAIGHRLLPMALAVGLVGVLAVFHGHAHGTEIPANASGLAYAAGFAAATTLLHAIGIGMGMGIGARTASGRLAPAAVRIGGAAIAAAGLALGVA